jgi:site-specific recombinase XerD
MLTQLINDFILSCRARRLSPRTIEWYEWLLSEYRAFTEKRGLDWTQPATLDAHLADIAARASAHTLHAHYRALRRFFRWLEKRHLIAENPMRMIEPPRLPARQPRGVQARDVEALLMSTDDSWHGRRDRAIILLLWDTGLRASELCNLNLEDLNLARRRLVVRSGKGDRDRTVFLGQRAAAALADWLTVRGEENGCSRIFISENGKPLTRRGLSSMLRRRKERSGVESPCNPHAFRHGFATAYLDNGGRIHNLQRLLGHTTLRSTEVYLWSSEYQAVADHAQASPGDHLK